MLKRLVQPFSIGVAAAFLVGGSYLFAGNPFISADKPFNRAAARYRAEFQIHSTNGTAQVVYRGKKVFSGTTSGQVLARRMNANGTDYAAVWDDQKVLWQSGPGVADLLGAKPAGLASGSASPPIRFRSPAARLRTTTVGGNTAVFFNDREVFSGPTRSVVTTKSLVVGTAAYAAAWDGNKLLWENVSGAAAQLP